MKEMLSEHFSREEVECPCCKVVNLDPELLPKLEALRLVLKRPLVPSSICRCHKHNKEVKGKPNSMHLAGKAADLRCLDTMLAYDFVEAAFAVGFGGVGVGPGLVHVDIRPIEVRRLWTY